MSLQDPVADMLTRLRNGQMAHKEEVRMPLSRLRAAVLRVLKEEGYIEGFRVEAEGDHQYLCVVLKYHEGKPVLAELRRVSRPGLRRYARCGKLPRVYGGLGVAVISTSRGVMTDHAARKAGVGGEILCTVF